MVEPFTDREHVNAPHIFQAQVENTDLHFKVTVTYRGASFSPDIHDMVVTRAARAYRAVIATHEPDSLETFDPDTGISIDEDHITVVIDEGDEENSH